MTRLALALALLLTTGCERGHHDPLYERVNHYANPHKHMVVIKHGNRYYHTAFESREQYEQWIKRGAPTDPNQWTTWPILRWR